MLTFAFLSSLRALLIGLALGVMPAHGQSDLLDGGHAKAQAVAAKASKQATKASAKQQQKLAKLQALHDGSLAAQDLLVAEQHDLTELLEQQAAQLAEAEALPAGDPAKSAAVSQAKKAVKASQRALSKLAKQAGKLAKQLAKIAKKADVALSKLSAATQQLEQADQDLSALAQPFDFGGFEDLTLTLTVAGPTGPLAGAFVSVHTPLAPPKGAKLELDDLGQPGPWFSGRTDDAGQLQAPIAVPAELSHVDVTVHVPGLSGEYTHESLREALGVFAPSARLVVSRQALDELSFTLWPTPELLEIEP